MCSCSKMRNGFTYHLVCIKCHALAQLCISYMHTSFILYMQLLVSVFGASIHRRHLMVWAVFGPRFLYEGAFQATTDVCVILVYTIFQRLEKHFID